MTGVADTVSRRRIFICRPTSASAATGCAERIVRALADKAYRGPVDADTLGRLMQIYYEARKEGDFEAGIRTTLQAILVSPRFLFRFEFAPAPAGGDRAAGASRTTSRSISEMELASRLSSFLWATLPDEALTSVAAKGRLRAQLGEQTKRMLADPRADALASRFAAQWLRLQELDKITPDPPLYPYFDHTLATAMAAETRLFFENLVREDRSVLELLTADYTFVNERLAAHYGITNVSGTAFRRVALPEGRRGVLGHASILTLTSIADRTSPVLRGKWVLEVMFGTPPPPPPPDVPDLEPARSGGKLLTVRERMEEHRASPACNSCHRVIDPLGLALEHFDVTGRYRIKDQGQPIDASGELYDGTKIDGLLGLRDVLLDRKDMVLQSFTENLMTYALGRRIEATDMPTVRAIVRAAAEQDYRISAFITAVIGQHSSARVQMRAIRTLRLGARQETAMFISKTHIPRRTVLRGMGATIALPLLDAMVPAGVALAQTAAASKTRLACIESVHGTAGATAFGTARHLWSPAANGRAFDLSPTAMRSLEPYRDYLTIISNTTARGAEARDLPEIGGDHFRSSAVFLTQAHPKQTQGSDVEVGVSLDQIHAQRFGQDTPIPSMQLCIENIDQAGSCAYGYACVYMDTISWAAPTQPLPMVRDPRAVFDQLFGLGGTPAQRNAQRKADRSILDWVADEFARLRPRLTPSDRARLSDYQEDIREIERRTADHRGAQYQRRRARAARRASGRTGRFRRAHEADVRSAGHRVCLRHHARVRVQDRS